MVTPKKQSLIILFLVFFFFFTALSVYPQDYESFPTYRTHNDRPVVKIASFNTLRLGEQGYDDKKDWGKFLHVLKEFDLIALIEIRSEDAVENIVNQLNQNIDGYKWEMIQSIKVGRKSGTKEYYERYASI